METLTQVFTAFPEALTAGILIAVISAFLGVFVVLKRLVFIGATLSETATCGIALALFFHFPPLAGALLLTFAAVSALGTSRQEVRVPRDAVMAGVFVFSASLGILLVSKSAFGLEEVKAFLYGDLVVTSRRDLMILSAAILPPALLVILFLRPILYTFLDRDGAKVLGIRTLFWELFFFYALALVVSASSKLGGMLLVFCHLVIPPMAGLLMTRRFLPAASVSAGVAVTATLAGFLGAYAWDFPVNQLIAFADCALLGLMITLRFLFLLFQRRPRFQ